MPHDFASLSTLALGLGLGLGLGLLSCTGSRPNPDHCFRAEGDMTCMERYGAERPYCTAIGCDGDDQNYGCVAERPATDECYSPCGAELTFLDDASCLGVADESTGSETATDSGTTETTGPGPCLSNAECPTEAPICDDSGECVACPAVPDPDAACAGLDPNTPVCDETSSACVQCLPDDAAACTGDTPVCDDTSNSCVGCAWHEQCQDACRMKTGACFDAEPLQAATPIELQQAIDDIAALDPPHGIVVLQDSGTLGSVTVPAGVTVAILGDPDQAIPNWRGVDGSPALTLEAGAEVYIQGVRIAGTQGALGIVVSGELWLDRSMVVNNAGGGLLVDGGAAVVRNAFVGGNNPGKVAIDVDGGSAAISFTTAYASVTVGTPAIALRCAVGDDVTVHNSIFVSTEPDDPEIVCTDAAITSSVLEDGAAFPGNTELPFIETWFEDFESGDYHLAPGMYPPAIDTAATWQPGDPLVDIDGDPRPHDDSPTAAGADLP
jgi:hypothetical protein